MTQVEMKKRAIILARCGVAGVIVATILATKAAQYDNWILWGVNCVLLLVCAACTVINYRIARVL